MEIFEEQKIQKLIKFECICNVCHSVHHWGILSLQGKNMDFLTQHACKINDCSIEEWQEYVVNCFKEWRERSLINWKIDTSYINNFRLDLI
ncbi:MAG: hypothetical protein M0Q13_11235 [Methanothrix sp.]|nr:hypothetical protein [Methanothrix sp.]